MKMNKRIWIGGAIVAAVVFGVALAQVPGVFTTVNAVTGYLVNGAAPSGQAICGNGTVGVYSTTCAIQAQTASSLVLTPRQCPTGPQQFSTGVAANGDANCALPGGVTGTLANVTASRSLGTTYTNSGTTALYVSGSVTTNVGGDTSEVDCSVNGITTWAQQANATVVGQHDAFVCGMVPPGGTYVVTTSGTSSATLASWSEFTY